MNTNKDNKKSRFYVMNNSRGITLISLIITIIVLLTLAGVATYSGVETINSSKYTRFTAELKIMQSYVNNWYEELSPTGVIGAEYNTQFTTNITNKFANSPVNAINAADNSADNAKIQKAQNTLEKANISAGNYQNFYLLEDAQKSALGIDGVSQSVLVDIKNRKVVSYLGLKYKNKMYYTIDDQSGEGISKTYNVEYTNPNTNAPQIQVTGKSVYNGETANNAKYKFTVNVTQGSDYINKGELYYGKIENGNVQNWNRTEDKSFIVDREGTYKIYYKDAAGNESSKIDYVIEPKATLIDGSNFNIKMKTLAGDENPTTETDNTNITQFKISDVKPDSSVLVNNNIVSTSASQSPVYMWFDNGTIWLWSEENWIGFNQTSQNVFRNLKNIGTILDLYKLDTSNVTNMNQMFMGCGQLTNLDVSKFNTQNVTNMSLMFYNCSQLTSLDVSKFNTQNVTNMNRMFYNCSQLTNLDVSKFNTQNVITMSSMFQGCSQLTNLDVSKFNTQNVINMNQMFYNCNQLTNLDVSKFNTQNVTNMSYMFYNCDGLTELDLSSFDTSKVTSMFRMFWSCNNITKIYVSDTFVVSALTNDDIISNDEIIGTNSSNLFNGCTKLVGGAGTTYNSNHVDADYAHIDGGISNPGYFTEKTT